MTANLESISLSVWKIVECDGKAVDRNLYPEVVPFLQFTEDGRFSGSGGCNLIEGKIIIGKADIAIPSIQMGKLACGLPIDILSDVEECISRSLLNSNKLFLEGNTLIFMKDDEVVLRMRDN